MEGLEVSKLQVATAKMMVKAGEVAGILDKTPKLNTFLLRNLWAVAHASSHVLFRALNRISEALSKSPTAEQLPLFDTPEDHAMTVKEIERWIDGFKDMVIGDYIRDDTGRGEFEQPGGLAAQIKAAIFSCDWMSWGEVLETFPGDETERVLWAMVNTSEIAAVKSEEDAVTEDTFLSATSSVLVMDIEAMLQAQPELGAPDFAGEVIPLYLSVAKGGADSLDADSGDPANPDVTDAVSVQIFATGGSTRQELYGLVNGASEMEVEAALHYLVETGKAEMVTVGEDIKYMPPGQDLEALHGDELRAVYERETGERSGRKGEDRMRKEIAQEREKRAEQ